MTHLNRITALSRKLRYILIFLMFFIPVATVLFWLFFDSLPQSFKVNLPVKVDGDLIFSVKMLALAVSAIPLSIKIAGILVLIQLFKLYEQGKIFAASNVVCFRRLGKILIIWFLSIPVHMALLSIVLTYQNQPGQRMLVVGLEEADITALLVGVMLIVISWVMDEGRELEEEQSLTI